jgi:hypothetical protein
MANHFNCHRLLPSWSIVSDKEKTIGRNEWCFLKGLEWRTKGLYLHHYEFARHVVSC